MKIFKNLRQIRGKPVAILRPATPQLYSKINPVRWESRMDLESDLICFILTEEELIVGSCRSFKNSVIVHQTVRNNGEETEGLSNWISSRRFCDILFGPFIQWWRRAHRCLHKRLQLHWTIKSERCRRCIPNYSSTAITTNSNGANDCKWLLKSYLNQKSDSLLWEKITFRGAFLNNQVFEVIQK